MWIEFDDVQKNLENLKSKLDVFVDKKKITKSQYTTLLHYTILALYTLTPPRRNKDYQNMLAVRSKKELGDLTDINKKYNYLDFDNKEFIFNNFKTKKNHGQQIIKIEDDLLDTPLFSLLIRDIVLIKNMGIKVILVPGARQSIDKILKEYN